MMSAADTHDIQAMTEHAEAIVDRVDNLVTLPEVYFEIKRIVDSPDSDIIDVAKAISTDAALTTRLLRIVNSPVYAQGRPVETVTRAVSMLGMIQVHDLALAVSLATSFSNMQPCTMDVTRFWRDSLLRAGAARKLAESCRIMDREQMFILGLLSDIGHMALYLTEPDAMNRVLLQQTQSGEAHHLIERRELGCDFAVVGAALLRRWHLPESLWVPIGQQNMPHPDGLLAAKSALLHVIDGALRARESRRDIGLETDPVAWSTLGITPEAVESAIADSEEIASGALLAFQR